MVAPDLHLERPRRGSNRERRTSRGPGRPGLLNVYPRQPEGASLCCSQYLAVAVSGSLITCFVGALFAMRRDAPINVARSDAVVTAGCLAVALASLVCGVAGRPKNSVAALVVIFATWIVRFLDGYCSPLFYRRIHALSESIDVLQWAGVVAIWVVNAGVWLSLAVVLGVEN